MIMNMYKSESDARQRARLDEKREEKERQEGGS